MATTVEPRTNRMLPMTLFAGAVAGLLAVGHPGFNGLDLALAVVGITAAHLANNLMYRYGEF